MLFLYKAKSLLHPHQNFHKKGASKCGLMLFAFLQWISPGGFSMLFYFGVTLRFTEDQALLRWQNSDIKKTPLSREGKGCLVFDFSLNYVNIFPFRKITFPSFGQYKKPYLDKNLPYPICFLQV